METPKIFISYSWKPDENKKWVEEFATQLRMDGIHVILDIWDLKPGQNKFQFMEQMVNDPGIKKVLLVCERVYSKKANSKNGGVGTESMIVSGEIYNHAKQEKFIPIVREYNDADEPFLPTFLKSRIYFDLVNELTYEYEYERLVRNIFDKPDQIAPPIGVPPAYITSERSTFSPTSKILSTVKKSLSSSRPNDHTAVNTFYNSFLGLLDEYVLENNANITKEDCDELYFEQIELMKGIRDDYIEFFSVFLPLATTADFEKTQDFFEGLLQYEKFYENKAEVHNKLTRITGDHIMFFIEELFIYSIALMVKFGRFDLLAHICKASFIIRESPHSEMKPCSFVGFNETIFLFEYRNSRLKLNRVNLFADTIKSRAQNPKVNFLQLQEADILLYFISCLQSVDNVPTGRPFYPYWFPNLTVYTYDNLPFLDKLVSIRAFEKIKSAFDVQTKEELFAKAAKFSESNQEKLDRFRYHIPRITRVLSPEFIGIYP